MNDLVYLAPNTKEPFTTSEVIAECAEVKHHAIGLGCFWLFCELSGAFYPAPPRKRKSR